MSESTELKWITPEQRENLRGMFKHEDEIWPEGYVQIWIPNDFNHFATVIGWKKVIKGECVLIAGFRNPFGTEPKAIHLPGDQYKYWCELPKFTDEMKAKREEICAEQDKGNYMYPYPEEA